MVRIKGRFADQVAEDYQRICLTVRNLLPMSLPKHSKLSGINSSTLGGFVSGNIVMDVHDLAAILRVAGLNTADLLLYAWQGQPPSLPLDLELQWKAGTLETAPENGDEVLVAIDACLRDHKLPRTSIPLILGWERVKPSGTMGRYLTKKIPFGWQRVLQVLHLADIQPAEFAERYLTATGQGRESATALA